MKLQKKEINKEWKPIDFWYSLYNWVYDLVDKWFYNNLTEQKKVLVLEHKKDFDIFHKKYKKRKHINWERVYNDYKEVEISV